MILPNNASEPNWSKGRLDEIATLLQKNHSLDIQPFAESFLVQSLERCMAATSMNNAADYARHLHHDGTEAEALIYSLNIGYSEFFRDPLVFALLGQMILPGLLGDKEKSGRRDARPDRSPFPSPCCSTT